MPDFVVHDELADFWAVTKAFYAADPVRHTVALTVIARRLANPSPDEPKEILVTAHDGPDLVGAAVRTPPWPLIASAIPVDLAADFVDFLLGIAPDLNGVSGERESADAFAAAWCDRTGRLVDETISMRLFRLGTLLTPAVPGRMRLATVADVEFLGPWHRAFMVEAMSHLPADLDHVAELRTQIEHGQATHAFWEVDGVPVSWAAVSPPVNAMSRVGPVYTPTEHRNHGYAAAITAAVSTWARRAGATEVLLYTDLANPTSNGVYQRIGFVPVLDAAELLFTTTST
ncbi:GNAT family N-acetyltransferase [Umezawaea endophytica]|uniref:GNAT family N-acetyltransferase n=1 Tax=Umezawaea endophytica TaxID=1654476 RepID=A0A9X3A664_9PSEU|nr:GNAT family N-acetyltransferase [Umezawaea endophytica]MCS7484469.1 GNAT family N-acetyltransferase [Umezawaea endophytica]